MLSKAKSKFIKSLQVKKYRKQEQCFLAEGAKTVQELLDSDFEVITLLGTPTFLSTIRQQLPDCEIIEVGERDLQGLAEFQTNNAALAVVRMKPNEAVQVASDEWGLVLDDIKDPGNLGTIIRTADWYGITKIIASAETADFYNGKVISATMGSFTRVEIFYTSLSEYLSTYEGKTYGAYLRGEDVHKKKFGKGGLLVIGSESHGISPDLEKYITDKITIPAYGKAESLNAAIATGIICDNIRRQ
jgi:TrmH family RNA methyltransferase